MILVKLDNSTLVSYINGQGVLGSQAALANLESSLQVYYKQDSTEGTSSGRAAGRCPFQREDYSKGVDAPSIGGPGNLPVV